MATNFQARNGYVVVPSNSENLPRPARGLFVSSAGTIKITLVDMADGTSLQIPSGAGQYHPLQVKRVWSDSTAGGIIALQ
jgi:hypothetical protein